MHFDISLKKRFFLNHFKNYQYMYTQSTSTYDKTQYCACIGYLNTYNIILVLG